MILIGESGATKASWAFISSSEIKRLNTSGIRCGTTSAENTEAVLNEVCEKFTLSANLQAIHFFCSGCFDQVRQQEMLKHFKQTFPNCREIRIKSDLHAAGLSALENKDGFGIILGTGSVGFTWKNNEVQKLYGGKGFPGGDFLGGADLGKRLINLFSSKQDHPLIGEFERKFGSLKTVKDVLSRELSPSDYGKLTPFVLAHRNNHDIAKLLEDALKDFFSDLPDLNKFENIGIVGSIGFLLKDEIQRFLRLSSHHNLSYIQHPIDQLILLFVTNLKST